MAPAGFGDRVEGLHAVAAALVAGRVARLTVEGSRAGRPPLSEILQAHPEVPVEIVDDVRPLADTTAPQGVVATCHPLRFVELEDLADPAPAALLAVDHVEDPHNAGAIARSALAAGVTGLILPDRRSAALRGAAFKAAAGAFERLRVAQVTSMPAALARLGEMGVWSVGLDGGGDRSIFDLDLLAEPVVLVVGAEAGLHRLVRERVDVLAAIPMAPGAESLNASVAAALGCFEVMRVRHRV
ncbi:MAG: RNA methyltransferase [Acidimicrobiia bacterium]|jgi:23S rRNA (guanosine2251-2'-O)-methyltransferase